MMAPILRSVRRSFGVTRSIGVVLIDARASQVSLSIL